jgi:hypothetical protein
MYTSTVLPGAVSPESAIVSPISIVSFGVVTDGGRTILEIVLLVPDSRVSVEE